jgi:3-oxoacyl-[acyl-carrier protein] reductase
MSASKCFAVIGDSRGIGEALREQLLGDGHQVIGVSRSGVQRAPSGPNDRYQSLVFDAVQHPCDLSGFTDRLDGLVYCPGSISLRPLRGLKREQFLKDWEINFYGAVQTLQANQALLNQSEFASVVLFSTVAVATGMPYHSSIAAAKGAVEGLTRSLAAEWAPKIRVNAIAPSLTDTTLAASLLNSDAKRSAAEDRHPMKRITSAAEVASLAVWLLDSNSSSMSGQVLALDGGISGVR